MEVICFKLLTGRQCQCVYIDDKIRQYHVVLLMLVHLNMIPSVLSWNFVKESLYVSVTTAVLLF